MACDANRHSGMFVDITRRFKLTYSTCIVRPKASERLPRRFTRNPRCCAQARPCRNLERPFPRNLSLTPVDIPTDHRPPARPSDRPRARTPDDRKARPHLRVTTQASHQPRLRRRIFGDFPRLLPDNSHRCGCSGGATAGAAPSALDRPCASAPPSSSPGLSPEKGARRPNIMCESRSGNCCARRPLWPRVES